MGFVDRYHNRFQTGGLQHLLGCQIRQVVGNEAFSSYYKFAIVRNPYDRAVSQYVYMARRPDLREYIGMRPGVTFNEYIRLIAKRRHVQWEPQYSFVYDGGTLLVDRIGRFERLADDARRIFRDIGIDCRLPHSNASVRSSYTEYLTEESRERIHRMYAIDFNAFGYSFD